MQKISLTQPKIRLLVCGVGVLLLVAIVAVVCNMPGASSRLDTKLKEYSQKNNISIEAIKSDKQLMGELQMEVNQEEKIDKLTETITVTNEEIANYREMLGSSMDAKKAVFILFNTRDECKLFIEENGNGSNFSNVGAGVKPLMQTDENGEYYNVVGNEALEVIFDKLKDGEYTKEPFEFSGMYGYLKRLGVSSPVSNDEELTELIKSEKAHEMLQKSK